MPATDTAVSFMTQHGVELSRSFRIASPPTKSIEYAIGKAPFSIHAKKHNMPTPGTNIVENIDDLHRAAEELTGRYVLKPNVKSPRWDELAGFKMLLAEDRAALLEGYQRCKDWCECFVVKECVAGSDEAMYSYSAFIADDKQIVAEAAGIEMTHLAYQSWVGQPLPSASLVRFPNARWISMKRDFAAAFAGWRQGEWSLAAYLRSIRGVRRRAVFDLRDPLPFLYDVLRSPGQFYRRRSEESPP